MKQKILVVVQEYPQVSETYIKNEVDALAERFDLELLALVPGSYPYRSRRPHIVLSPVNQQNILDYLKGFGPTIVHGHYLSVLGAVTKIAHALKVPYTLRAHSFDVLGGDLAKANLAAVGSDSLFRGVLCFPFMRQRLIGAGLPDAKVLACTPVIDVMRFRDAAPNGPAIMTVGAPAPKKSMEDFIKLSRFVPDRKFNLYGLGYETPRLVEINARLGGKVNFIAPWIPRTCRANTRSMAGLSIPHRAPSTPSAGRWRWWKRRRPERASTSRRFARTCVSTSAMRARFSIPPKSWST